MPDIEDDLDELSLDYNKFFKKRAFYLLVSKIYIIIKNEELIQNNNNNKIIIYKNDTKDIIEPKNYKKTHNFKYSLYWTKSELIELNILNNNKM